jgi:hypothetical protein
LLLFIVYSLLPLPLATYAQIAKQIGGLNTRPITSAWAIDELLALMTLDPVVGSAIMHLLKHAYSM